MTGDPKSLRIPSSMFFALLTLNKKNPLAHVTWCIFVGGFFDECKMGKKTDCLGGVVISHGRFHVNLGIYIIMVDH